MKKKIVSMFLAAVLLVCMCAGSASAAAPSIAAPAAIVVDCQTGEIYYQKNIDTARPVASMTKLMTLYLVFEEIDAGRLSLDSYVTASAYAAGVSNNREYSGLEGLKTGKTYKVDTLIRLIMTASCNGSVIVLAERVGGTEAKFVQMMNEKAAEWGIDAHFADCTGFENEGNAVTARAMAYIARRIIQDHPKILEYSSLTSTTFNGKTFWSTNGLMRNGTVKGIDGLKTGTTSKAGYCFTGTAVRDGRRIISVVMGAANGTARMTQSQTLLEYGFACRAEREKVWAAAAGGVKVDMACEGGTVYPYVDNRVTATFSNVSGATDVKMQWELNGEALGAPADLVLKDGAAVSTSFKIREGVEAKPAVVLTFPDGTKARREVALPTHTEPLSFVGYLGVQRIELYPEISLRIPFTGACAQGLSVTVPMAWYLDGEPIAGFRNDAFQFSPSGSSAYTLRTGSLKPGTHMLELRVNPDGLPGLAKTSFLAEIVVLEIVKGTTAPAA